MNKKMIKEPAIRMIMSSAYYLKKFAKSHSLQRGVWDNIPAECRKAIISLGYVKVDENVVYLTLEGLAILGYKEHIDA